MKGTELIRTICFTLCLALGATALAEEGPTLPSIVDINMADAETLAAVLDGVGVVKAQAIIRYRETHGAFTTVEELANVTGIGLSTVDRNLDRITLGER
ncbi:MAG TPA: ComEA family DNA-binding protein [Pseudomonadales bacterium]|nr:ComEA family DNA-binding protein [Pseudomonadales bacterium]